MSCEQLDQARAILARYPLDAAELLEVLAGQLAVEPVAFQRDALADPRFDVVCRPLSLSRWDREWRDDDGRIHYGNSGDNTKESVFLRLRR